MPILVNVPQNINKRRIMKILKRSIIVIFALPMIFITFFIEVFVWVATGKTNVGTVLFDRFMNWGDERK